MSLHNKTSNLDKDDFHFGKCLATLLVAGVSFSIAVDGFFAGGDILAAFFALLVFLLCVLAASVSQFWTKVHSLSDLEKVIVYAPIGIFWVTGAFMVMFLKMAGFAIKQELK